MQKIYSVLLFLFFHGYFCMAQNPSESDDNRVEMVKMAYITRELNLNPQEAQNFWPVYNNYQNEIKKARNQHPDNEVEFEKKVVEIKQRYQGNFKKVLGSNNQRINKVYTSDRQFNNTLRNELNNRRQNQNKARNFQEQQQQPRQQMNQAPKNNGNQNNKNIKRANGNRRPHPPF